MDLENEGGGVKPIRCKIYQGHTLPAMNIEHRTNPKKDGRVRMCVDFRDLNKTSPEDDFLLPYIDILVDNTIIHALLSFTNGHVNYNQVKLATENMKMTTFITLENTYCYSVMPFE